MARVKSDFRIEDMVPAGELADRARFLEAARQGDPGAHAELRRRWGLTLILDKPPHRRGRVLPMKRVLLALLILGLVVPAWAAGPPVTWHPYTGGVNCVQVADANGNFNCSPLVTINPSTGVLSILAQVSSVPVYFGGLALIPGGVTPQVLGSGDLVLSTSASSIAPAGPQIAGVTVRVRQSPITPGFCQVVVAGGNGFAEYPVLVRVGVGTNAIEFPGGSSGC